MSNIKEIIAESKKKKGPLAQIMEERSSEAQVEYEETKIRRLIAEEKTRIEELKRTGQPMQPGLAVDFTTRIMNLAQVDPEKAQAFIKGLDQEDLNKLAFLMAAESDRAGSLLSLAKSSGTSIKDLVEVVKLMRPNNGGTDLKGVAEVFKLGIEAAKANNPQPKTQAEGIKEVMGIVQPFVDALTQKDKEIYEARLEAIEQRIPAPLPEQIKHYKDVATALGMGTQAGKASELDLKLEEMRQTRDIDLEKLRWEQKKFLLQQEAERDKWTNITQTLSPILQMNAPAIQNAVRNVARDVGKNIQPQNQASDQPQVEMVAFTCPKCDTELSVPIPPNAPPVIPVKCPKCGEVTPAQLGEPSQPPKEEPPPSKTHLRPTYT